MTVLVAGASYNLFACFQQIGAAQGYGKSSMTLIKYTVLFGYYFGIGAGLIVKITRPLFSFLTASLMALIAFSTLGYITEHGEGDTFTWIIMIFMLFIGSMSGSIATVGAIVTAVKNSPRVAGMLIVVIMVSYFKVAPYFEFLIRSAFFTEVSLMWYFISYGAIMAAVFFGAAFAIHNAHIDDAIENIMRIMDRMAILIFVAVEVIFLIGYFIASIILENWFIGAILFIVFIVLNFIALAGAIGIIYTRLKSLSTKDLMSAGLKDNFNEKLFLD